MTPDRVAIADVGPARYPPPPFDPGKDNRVYAGITELFEQLGLDATRAGTRDWNPLAGLVGPGDRVLIKPNLVRHYHPYGYDRQSLVTHGSLVRAVCDYVLRAAGPGCKLVVADAPLQSCDFAEVVRLAGLDELAGHYRRIGIDFELRDLRLVKAVVEERSLWGRVLVQAQNGGDPLGYTAIDLGSASAHAEAGRDAGGRYRVTCYDPARMRRHHGGGRHEYIIANTLLDSDVVINLPKMKTHHKAGITVALKNFIGINGHKDCLPHHTKGTPQQGGDEYRSAGWVKRTDSWLMDAKEQYAGAAARKAAADAHTLLQAVHQREGFWEGSWYGNETIARTTIDLNRIVRFASRGGGLSPDPQRRVLSIVDAVIAGDGDGPLAPDPQPAGLLLAGLDPVAVDMAAARLMGFRPRSIPTIRLALDRAGDFRLAGFAGERVSIVSKSARWDGIDTASAGDSLGFRPHKGWKGNIEL
jgi:uncharacterized protein (DUF362 family)